MAAFAEFREADSPVPIWINPEFVMRVEERPQRTTIHTSDGGKINVKGKGTEVLAKLGTPLQYGLSVASAGSSPA